MNTFQRDIQKILEYDCGKTIREAAPTELYHAVARAAVKEIRKKWEQPAGGKRACYFSAEFLIGRLIYSNLLNMGRLEDFSELMKDNGVEVDELEEIEDAALGNGGLGRLAACFWIPRQRSLSLFMGMGYAIAMGCSSNILKMDFKKRERTTGSVLEILGRRVGKRKRSGCALRIRRFGPFPTIRP